MAGYNGNSILRKVKKPYVFVVASGAALILLPHLARYAGCIVGAAEKAYVNWTIRELEKEMNRRVLD